MKAAFYEAWGSPADVLQIGELPEPQPAPGEVRVKLHVSAVNPSDTKSRCNWRGREAMPFQLIVPHQDGAGFIYTVGAGVNERRLGERVWLHMSQTGSPWGTAAQYTVVPEWKAVPLPRNTSYSEGAMLGIPALTAHYLLFKGGPIVGETILVQGGAGAVGFYAIQLAKWGGAKLVVATVSRAEQAEQALRGGADLVVNYKTENVIERVRAETGDPNPVNMIVEVAFGVNQDVDAALIAENGVIASYGSDRVRAPSLRFDDFLGRDVTLRTALIYEAPPAALNAAIRDISNLLETGRLKHHLAVHFPLADIVRAHADMEAGRTIGKILLDIE